MAVVRVRTASSGDSEQKLRNLRTFPEIPKNSPKTPNLEPKT